MEEKIKQNPFLKNLKEALEKGEPNESTKIINDIEDTSKTISANEAKDRIEKRIEEVGYAEISDEDMKKNQEEYTNRMGQIKSDEEKFQFVADIENAKSMIGATKDELNHVIAEITKKYDNILSDLKIELESKKINFKNKYGEEVYKEYFEKETK